LLWGASAHQCDGGHLECGAARETIAIRRTKRQSSLIIRTSLIGEGWWRGFALPRLQTRFNSLTASLILGGLWAAWHLPNSLIPGLEYYLTAFPVFLVYVVSMTVLFTWLANHTRGSVWIAWLFHAAINVPLDSFIGDNLRQWWLSADCLLGIDYHYGLLDQIVNSGSNGGCTHRADNRKRNLCSVTGKSV
jgi:hypothetical protein